MEIDLPFGGERIYISEPEIIREREIIFTKEITEEKYTVERPINNSSVIPPGFREDVKKFTIASVDNTTISKQLTELLSMNYYIIKEVRFYFSGVASTDAAFHVTDGSVDGAGNRFIEGYYWEGSFCILSGNRNGHLDRVLTAKPYIFITAGTGAIAQTVYGSVKYYYK